MSRRIVLVDLYWTRDKDPRVPLGHASLLAALRTKTSADIRSLALPVNVNRDQNPPERVAAAILAEVGDIPAREVDVALGAYVWAEDLLQPVLRELRRRGFEGRIILGGPQISYSAPGISTFYPQADIFIRGYGEDALCALATTGGRPTIRGVHYARTRDLAEQTEVDLSSLPSPWLTEVLLLDRQRFIRWETQRGCPFRCTFCQHREPGMRLPRAKLAHDRVVKEIDLFCAAKVEKIAVLDPIFNLGERATEMLERFAHKRFTGRLSLQCRAECVDTSFLRAVKSLPATRLEFGLQTIHAREGEAVERHNDMGKVDAALAQVRDCGIDHEVSLIYGLPEQTLESFRASVTWCLERRVPVIHAFPLMLLRGTKLELDRHRWSLEDNGESMPTVVASSTFGREECREMAQLSEALRRTEGHHPSTLGELQRIARTVVPNPTRWRPAPPAVGPTLSRFPLKVVQTCADAK